MKKYVEGLGSRKTSVARVRVFEGNEPSLINGKPMEDVVKSKLGREDVMRPLVVTNTVGKVYFTAKSSGGGITGQREAIRLGLSRALLKMDTDRKSVLRKAGLITRDPREVERKKYFHIKARKKPQFSKR